MSSRRPTARRRPPARTRSLDRLAGPAAAAASSSAPSSGDERSPDRQVLGQDDLGRPDGSTVLTTHRRQQVDGRVRRRMLARVDDDQHEHVVGALDPQRGDGGVVDRPGRSRGRTGAAGPPGTAASGSSTDRSEQRTPSSSRRTSAKRRAPGKPGIGSTMSMTGISSTTRTALLDSSTACVRVAVLMSFTSGSPTRRRLDKPSRGGEGRLVGDLLQLQVHRGAGQVDVLDLRERRGQARGPRPWPPARRARAGWCGCRRRPARRSSGCSAVSSVASSVCVVAIVPARTESARAVRLSNRLAPCGPKASGPSTLTATLTSLPIVRCTVAGHADEGAVRRRTPPSRSTMPPKTGRPR